MRVLVRKNCISYGNKTSGQNHTVKFPLKLGADYLVVGLGIAKGSHEKFSGNSFYIYCDEANLIFRFPSELFEVLDPRPGLDWIMSYNTEHQDMCIGPELLVEEPFFLDDLTGGDPLARKRMRQILAKLGVVSE